MTESNAGTERFPNLPAAAWAAFLACSWTWCIGMFLPVVLLRDYGIWGFVIFAVPNVIGAGSIGWVIRSPEIARRLLDRHRLAIGLFSAVTIAFHVYFLAWIGSWMPGVLGLDRKIVSGILTIALLAFVGLSVASVRTLVLTSVPLWLLSGALIGTLMRIDTRTAAALPPVAIDEPALLWLTPVMIFGFALCPYLDGTFLTARASLSNGRAKVAFGLGFGVLFLAMIVGTVLYAPLLESTLGGHTVARWVGAFLLIHLLLQSIFTISAHRRASTLSAVPAPILWTLLLIAAGGAVLATRLPDYAGLSAGEIGYKAFLVFYGLVFPAFVWLFMIPGRHTGQRGSNALTRGGGFQPPIAPRQHRLIFAAAVGIALPMFWMGFIERQELFLVPGILIVLASRLMLRTKGQFSTG
jgi:hypothetical protein